MFSMHISRLSKTPHPDADLGVNRFASALGSSGTPEPLPASPWPHLERSFWSALRDRLA
jgi:hypothetical protein